MPRRLGKMNRRTVWQQNGQNQGDADQNTNCYAPSNRNNQPRIEQGVEHAYGNSLSSHTPVDGYGIREVPQSSASGPATSELNACSPVWSNREADNASHDYDQTVWYPDSHCYSKWCVSTRANAWSIV